MWLVLLGVFQILLHVAEIGPFAKWTWDLSGELWLFTWPFIGAVIWWAWADGSGYNARKEMEALDHRREDRRAKNLVDLGMRHKVDKRRR